MGVFYALFVGLFVYRSINLDVLISSLTDTVAGSAVVMFVVAFAGLFSWAAATLGVIDGAAALVQSLTTNKWIFLLLITVVFLIAGMFLDAISITYVFMPILLPVILKLQIDPLYFGVVMTIALAIGMITPPVAVNLYVVSNIIKENINDRMIKFVVPMVLIAIVALVFIIFVPDITLWLPEMSGLYTRKF
jgi:C4-dicarboxylate transporter DctM subunit